jgi:hypothetical protein
MNIGERIGLIISEKKLNKRRFAIEVDYSDVGIGKVVKGEIDPGYKLLFAIISKFTDVNVEWLLTGNGQMLKESQPIKESKKEDTLTTQQIFELLKKQLAEKDKQIAEKDKQITALAEALKEAKNDVATPAEKQRRAAR